MADAGAMLPAPDIAISLTRGQSAGAVTGLQPGQQLAARVIGANADGTTRIAIAGQTLALALEDMPPAGTVLRLVVGGAPGRLTLSVVPQPPGAGMTVAAQQLDDAMMAALARIIAVDVALEGSDVTARLVMSGMPAGVDDPAPESAAGGAVVRTLPPLTAGGTLPARMLAVTVENRPAQLQLQTGAPVTTRMPDPDAAIPATGTRPAPDTAPVVRNAAPVALLAASGPARRPEMAVEPAAPSPRAVPADLPVGSRLAARIVETGAVLRLTTLAPPEDITGHPVTGQSAAAAAPPGRSPETLRMVAALSEMVRDALPQQGSIARLLGTLMDMGDALPALPEAVSRPAAALLRSALPLDDSEVPMAADLMAAVARSGVFSEARIAAGGSDGDLKTAVLAMRAGLADWLGPATAPPGAETPPAPPIRGAWPRALQSDLAASTPPPADLREAGRLLQHQADAALGRLRLTQVTSLNPPPLPGVAGATARAPAEWNVEIPVLLGQQPTMVHFQVQRDGHGSTPDAPERRWRMRFALELPAIGEVGADIGLSGHNVSVGLWADRPATAAALSEALPDLGASLAIAGLDAESIAVRPTPPRRSGSGQ